MADELTIAVSLARLAKLEAAAVELDALKSRIVYYSVDRYETFEENNEIRPTLGDDLDRMYDEQTARAFGKAAAELWTKHSAPPGRGSAFSGRGGLLHHWTIAFVKGL